MSKPTQSELSRKVRMALDETRLLILGAQVLFGFQLQAVFQELFAALPLSSRSIECTAQLLMTISVACLITPSMLHRIAEQGRDSVRIQQAATLWAGVALLPFALSLGLDFYLVFEPMAGQPRAVVAGLLLFSLAVAAWYGLELILKPFYRAKPMSHPASSTPLSTKIENMLREARVILPGAQALLGFQLVVTLTARFSELSPATKGLHLAALCSVALATIVLMMPAALHRITFAGEDSETFLRAGSYCVIIAPLFLGLGIAGDLYVAISSALHSRELGIVLAAGVFITLSVLWYALPLILRHRWRFTGST